MHHRPGLSSRSLLVTAILLTLLLLVGVLLWRMPWIQSLFRSDADNVEEAAKLKDAPLTVASIDPSSGWPQWFGPHRDGRAPAGPLRTDWEKRPPAKLWEAPCGGGFGSMAVVGGKLYIHDRHGGTDNAAVERLRCLDAATGQPVWEYLSTSDYTHQDRKYANGPRATPTVDGDRIYTVGGGGLFLCVQSPAEPNGAARELWRHELLTEFNAKSPQWGVACSPLVEGDLVIVQPGGKHGSVAAFDRQSGQLRWKVGSNPSGYSSPVAATIAGRRVILAMTGNALLAIGVDGQLLDEYSWKTDYDGNIATPIVVEDYIFISSGYNHGCALLRLIADGKEARLEQVFFRNNKVMRNHHSTCVYKDGHLYGFDDSLLKCVDFRSLREQWDFDDVSKGCLILADRYLVILTESGDLALVETDPKECKLLAKVASGLRTVRDERTWALPVLVDGRLYLRDQSKILCLDVK